MEDPSKLLWQDRLRRIGHTGWADHLVYGYDQLSRIKTIRKSLADFNRSSALALDFGCGTGDFSKLLLSHGFFVCGYDPYVKPEIHDQKFFYCQNTAEIPYAERTVDLIITITVLDHILSDISFVETIRLFGRLLNNTGRLIMLEYALDSEEDRKRYGLANNYQAFRSFAVWRRVLEESGFKINRAIPIYLPFISPSPGFVRYSRDWRVRVVVKLAKLFGLRAPFLLKKIAETYLKGESTENYPASSPLKLMVCECVAPI
ncbi:MAG: class I SAM-dependent methyltransferase [Xanthobacteraceae bacterium]